MSLLSRLLSLGEEVVFAVYHIQQECPPWQQTYILPAEPGASLTGSALSQQLQQKSQGRLWLALTGSQASFCTSWSNSDWPSLDHVPLPGARPRGGQSHLDYLNWGWGLRIRGWVLGQAETTNTYHENRVQSCLFYEAFSHYFTLLRLEWPVCCFPAENMLHYCASHLGSKFLVYTLDFVPLSSVLFWLHLLL